MATFISLIDFTPQGVRDIKVSPERAAQFKSMAQETAVTVKEIYWTIGIYDAVIIFEAQDDEAAVGLMLKLASLGNVKPHTLRAFDAAEMKEIIAKAF